MYLALLYYQCVSIRAVRHPNNIGKAWKLCDQLLFQYDIRLRILFHEKKLTECSNNYAKLPVSHDESLLPAWSRFHLITRRRSPSAVGTKTQGGPIRLGLCNSTGWSLESEREPSDMNTTIKLPKSQCIACSFIHGQICSQISGKILSEFGSVYAA